MDMRIILFGSSLALTAVVASVIWNSTDEEWRAYQLDYYDQAMGRASNETVKQALASSGLEIKQDMLIGFGQEQRVDRCRTCHVAIDDPAFADGEQPLVRHPEMEGHSFSSFGCTICHEGDGRALDTYHAHGEDHHWPHPLRTGAMIEANCALCHPAPYPEGAPHLQRGRELFEDYACGGCHTVRGVSRGKEGPELSAVGHQFHTEYIEESIREPRANMAMSVMPAYDMPAEDLEDLLVYLTSLRGLTLFEDPVTAKTRDREWKDERPSEVPVTAAQGRESLEASACLACHQLGEADGGFSPSLDWQGLLREPEWVAEHIAEPRDHTPGSSMPSFWMSESERDAIALYLDTYDVAEPETDPETIYLTYCARCHGEDADGHGPIADNLLPVPREFNNAKFFNWLPESRAHKAILEGVPGTAMPPYAELLATITAPAPEPLAEGVAVDEDEGVDTAGTSVASGRKPFAEGEGTVRPLPEDPAVRKARAQATAEELFAWVRAVHLGGDRPERKTTRKVPERNPVPYDEASVLRGQTEFRKRCYGCHGFAADGKGPNAADLIPRPRDLTNGPFFADMPDSRLYESITYGIVGTGMPPWDYLSETVRWDMVNYVRSTSETIDPTATHEGDPHE